MGQICCACADNHKSKPVVTIVDPAPEEEPVDDCFRNQAEEELVDDCPTNQDGDAENMDAVDGSKPSMYRKMGAPFFCACADDHESKPVVTVVDPAPEEEPVDDCFRNQAEEELVDDCPTNQDGAAENMDAVDGSKPSMYRKMGASFFCAYADDHESKPVVTVVDPAPEEELVDDCPTNQDGAAENMDAVDGSKPSMYRKMGASFFIGLDFPEEQHSTEESNIRSSLRMQEISDKLRTKHGSHIFNEKPTFKHLKIQANVVGAPNKFLVVGSRLTQRGASIAKDATRIASSVVRTVSGYRLGSTGALRDRFKGAKPMEIKPGRKLPGKSPGKKHIEEENEQAAEEVANLAPEEADTHGHGAEALAEVAGTQAAGIEAMETEGTEGVVHIPNIIGIWKCIDTWGLEAFLKSCGAGFVQRKAAIGAPWPWWAFDIDDELKIHFVNHGPLGEVEEHIDTSGKTYISLDAKKQKLSNTAQWEGDSLIIDRIGPQGEYQEKRTLDADDKLQFSLELMSGEHKGQKWGRVFQRSNAS